VAPGDTAVVRLPVTVYILDAAVIVYLLLVPTYLPMSIPMQILYRYIFFVEFVRCTLCGEKNIFYLRIVYHTHSHTHTHTYILLNRTI
jgi:hypothetical protein